VSEIRGSHELGGSSGVNPRFECLDLREAKSRSAESQHEGYVAELHSGPGSLTSRHTLHIWRSQHPIDLSRLGDSGDKEM
jgi:hypothetical protein